jgi:anti-anti-sigma factor
MRALIEMEQRDGICILHCRGRFVPGPDSERMRSKIEDIKRLNCTKVVADFSEVRSLGSTGITFIVSVYNTFTARSGGDFVIADVVAPVREVLNLTGLSSVIPIAEDFASALAAIHGGGIGVPMQGTGLTLKA